MPACHSVGREEGNGEWGQCTPIKRSRGGGVHDIAVDLGMDPETAALLREVASRKDAAVADEDFITVSAIVGRRADEASCYCVCCEGLHG